ncbi:glycerol-3-phosphate dehydrogenase [Actinopolyspora xinjiangensis]|uniref:Glycerol-3-phosphate dehydrogenase n=1 Tax=Actinopolyspora xinjiangensis TaxID=405564 RepID=A0A1H0P019_9ACTN|nr:FAD-dependent oxidoreductase [Actinopolyspora xinjiangensis]SDO98000.1 glycerol-3-phosphate dehydrogenase [Actinopolyspora xinjiangensis]
MTSHPAGTPPRATSLHAARRDAELAELAGGVRPDVLVVGGGVTGTATALDAAARGLSVALVEAEDLAGRTPRRSDVLPGGLPRDNGPLELARARRDAVECETLSNTTAPHLVRTLPLLLPLDSGVPRGTELAMRARLAAESAMRLAAGTPTTVLPTARRIPAAEARALAPGLPSPGPRGGLLSFGTQLADEARLVVALARTAAGFGARVLTRVRATRLHRDGADVVDRLADTEIRVRARAVINATGLRAAELVDGLLLNTLRIPGAVLETGRLGLDATGVVTVPAGRAWATVRCVPQPDGRSLLTAGEVELTGTPPELPELQATGRAEENDLLEAASRVLGRNARREPPLEPHVVSHALPRRTARRSDDREARPDRRGREHHVHTSPAGVISVVRGRLAPYRTAAAEAVDVAVRGCGLRAGGSRTATTPLVGAASRGRLAEAEVEQRLIDRYGTEAERVSAMTELDPALAEPVAPGLSTSVAEVVWAVRHEGAMNAADVLDRRMPPGLGPESRAAALPPVADVVTRALRGVYH